MRRGYRGFGWIGLLLLVVLSVPCVAGAKSNTAAKDSDNSIVITFKDGRQQIFPLAAIARIEFKSPAVSSAKSDNSVQVPGRRRFVGKWTVGDGGGNEFQITLEENGQATNTAGNGGRGTWTYVDGEAHVSWDGGWHDAIRKAGTKYMKFAYAPGTSFSGKAANVTEARNSTPEPI